MHKLTTEVVFCANHSKYERSGEGMSRSATLEAVLDGYSAAKSAAFAGNPLAAFIRGEAVGQLQSAAAGSGAGLQFAGSAGAGNWAEVPWLAAFDPIVTDSATRGYYVVYLFHSSEPTVHLSLNQGTTVVREEFGATARQVLADRAALIRERLSDFVQRLPVTQIELGSTSRLRGITPPVMRWVSAITATRCLKSRRLSVILGPHCRRTAP